MCNVYSMILAFYLMSTSIAAFTINHQSVNQSDGWMDGCGPVTGHTHSGGTSQGGTQTIQQSKHSIMHIIYILLILKTFLYTVRLHN
jgi:hypothetical protein